MPTEQKMEHQLNIGEKVSLTDAAQLPPGCWVSSHKGLLIECQANSSVTAIIYNEPEEFILVGEPGRTPYNVMRQRARQADVEPAF